MRATVLVAQGRRERHQRLVDLEQPLLDGIGLGEHTPKHRHHARCVVLLLAEQYVFFDREIVRAVLVLDRADPGLQLASDPLDDVGGLELHDVPNGADAADEQPPAMYTQIEPEWLLSAPQIAGSEEQPRRLPGRGLLPPELQSGSAQPAEPLEAGERRRLLLTGDHDLRTFCL